MGMRQSTLHIDGSVVEANDAVASRFCLSDRGGALGSDGKGFFYSRARC